MSRREMLGHLLSPLCRNPTAASDQPTDLNARENLSAASREIESL